MDFDKVSDNEWEEIILNSDYATFFHSPTWAKIMEKTFNYRKATRLYNINGKEILVPMMEQSKYGLNNFSSMPGNKDVGGLFSESDITTDDFNKIVNDIIGGRNLSFSIAFSPFMNPSSFESSSIKKEWIFEDEWNYVHILNLEGKDFDGVWNDFHKKTRGSIRKAKKSGVEVRDATSLDDFRSFDEIISKASKRWESVIPPVPFRLFENLYNYASSNTKLTLATKDDKIIAGLLSFPYSKTIYLYLSAYLGEYGTYQPTSLLISKSIEQACQEGYKYINFGPSGNLKHLIKIKEKWGAEKMKFNRYRAYSNLAKILDKINNLRSNSTEKK